LRRKHLLIFSQQNCVELRMNISWLLDYNPIFLAFMATLFTWAVTALGASLVFFFKTINRRVLNLMLGFAAGVMIFVVVEELIPELQTGGETDLSSIGVMIGFGLMMLLDVALG